MTLEIRTQPDAVIVGDESELYGERAPLPCWPVFRRQEICNADMCYAGSDEVIANASVARIAAKQWIGLVHAAMVLDVQRLAVVDQSDGNKSCLSLPICRRQRITKTWDRQGTAEDKSYVAQAMNATNKNKKGAT